LLIGVLVVSVVFVAMVFLLSLMNLPFGAASKNRSEGAARRARAEKGAMQQGVTTGQPQANASITGA
jgi:hypothetical protein